MYAARRAVDATVIAATPVADGATAAALRAAPRRAVVSPTQTFVRRYAPAGLSVALVASAVAIGVGSRAQAGTEPGAEQVAGDTAVVRADQLSRGATRAIKNAAPSPAPVAEAPVAAAWSAQFGAIAATWFAQADTPVRALASADAATLTTIKSGEQVQVTERVVGEFREVVVNQTIGWVPDAQVGATAPVAGDVPLSPGKTSASRVLGLTPQAMGVYNAVMSRWGGAINAVGGYRSRSLSDHQFGRAIDFMVTPGKESALGWSIAKYLAANADELGVDHIIFEQKIWTPGNPTWRPMGNRGGITANHFDHVHASVRR